MVHPSIPDELFGGTSDVLLYNDTTLIIIDLKYGFSQIYADSAQLTAYTLLAAATLGRQFERYVQFIVQPRAETSVSRHERPSGTDSGLERDIQRSSVRCIQQRPADYWTPAGSLNAGPHCKWCKRREGCPARMELIGGMTEVAVVTHPKEGSLMKQATSELTTEQLLFFLDRGDVLKEFLGDCLRSLLERASAGEEVRQKLIASYSDRAWKEDDEIIRKKIPRHKIGLKAADIVVQKLKSPAQVEKTMKELGLWKDNKDRFDELHHTVCTGVKLVDKKARGEAIRPETAVEMISRIKEAITE